MTKACRNHKTASLVKGRDCHRSLRVSIGLKDTASGEEQVKPRVKGSTRNHEDRSQDLQHPHEHCTHMALTPDAHVREPRWLFLGASGAARLA